MSKELQNLMIDAASGLVENFSTADVNAAIREQFYSVLGTDANSNRKEIRKAIRKNKAEVFDLIEETIENLIENSWVESDFFNTMVEVRNLMAGDRNEFVVPANGILTMAEFSGGHHDIERQRLGVAKTVQVKTNWYGVKIYDEFELFLAGRIDWAKYVERLYKALDSKINDMVINSFLGIEKDVPAEFKVTSSPDEEKIAELVDKVQAKNGSEVIIVGSRAALAKLAKTTASDMFSDNMKDERNTQGVIGTWLGTKVMMIPQIMKAGTNTLAVPQDKLYVLPLVDEKPIKLVQEGDTIYTEQTDGVVNRDMTLEGELQTKMGVATVFGSQYGLVQFA